MFNQSINVNTFRKLKNISNFEKDSIINKLETDLDISNKRVITITQKNKELNRTLLHYKSLKDKISSYEEALTKKDEEKIKLIKEKDEQNSQLFNKIASLENTIEINRSNYEKDSILYRQKMQLYNVLHKENQVYAEEKANFDREKKLYEQKKDDEMNSFKVRQNLKYIKFKNQMDKDFKELNNNLISANSEYISANHRLVILQNKELYYIIEQQEKRIEELEKSNENLRQKIIESKNDLNIQKLIGRDLTKKLELKNPIRLTRNRSVINHISSENNISSEIKLRTNSDYSNLIPNSYTQGVNNSQFLEKKISEYKKIIEEKNYENGKLILKNTHLRSKLNLYQTKFNGLFNFLKESLNNFCNDDEIKKSQNFYINLDKIKKCNFESFNKKEKYSLLILLMKHLLPLISINFNYSSNLGKNLFKTNLNIVNKNFNTKENYLNDETLRSAFCDKKNKIYKNLSNPSRTKFSFSVPVLKRVKQNEINFYEDKNRVII